MRVSKRGKGERGGESEKERRGVGRERGRVRKKRGGGRERGSGEREVYPTHLLLQYLGLSVVVNWFSGIRKILGSILHIAAVVDNASTAGQHQLLHNPDTVHKKLPTHTGYNVSQLSSFQPYGMHTQ
jgi:hypothetical protein